MANLFTFPDRLNAAIRARRTPAVVGIDPVYESLPQELRTERPGLDQAAGQLEQFCRTVIDIAAPRVPAVKLNIAFFEALYDRGLAAYYRLVAHAHARGLLVIGDIKRGDIGSTAKLYARGHLENPVFAEIDPASIPDAVTLAGYLGEGAVRPFIEACAHSGRGVYVLVRPSDPGADAVHDFDGGVDSAQRHANAVDPSSESRVPVDSGRPRFFQHMARLVRAWGAAGPLIGECGLSAVGAVVAPKDTASTAALREAMPHAPFLVPGYGAQGAGAEACRACFLRDGSGAIVNASRSVIYAFARPEFAERRARKGWAACIDEACAQFAADVAPLAGF